MQQPSSPNDNPHLLERIDALEIALAEALRLATTDSLTELDNRRGWLQALEREEARAARHGLDLVVAVVDVDDLKTVNDERGHEVGDELLRSCASALRRAVRGADTVARLGGDEFGILTVQVGGEAAEAVEHRLVAALADAGIAASVGTCAAHEAEDAQAAWQRADERMLARKAEHRRVR